MIRYALAVGFFAVASLLIACSDDSTLDKDTGTQVQVGEDAAAGADIKIDADRDTEIDVDVDAPDAPSTPTFREDFNGTTIDASVWQVASWVEHGGQTSPERTYVRDGYLHMEFEYDTAVYQAEGLFLSSAIQTWDTFLYGKWEARLKPASQPGVLNSFYTIDWGDGDGTHQEIDIEFLTKSFSDSAGEVHYAVHAQGASSFNTNPDVALSFDPSADFDVYGFEITAERVRWTVDGAVVREYVYEAPGPSITAPYQLKLNTWSQMDGWIGGPPPADTVTTYLIDWIQFSAYEE